MNDIREDKGTTRLLGLDRIKGFCVFLMLFIKAAGFFPKMGFFYSIGTNIKEERLMFMDNIAYADFEVIFFLFLLGMSYILSFRKREAINRKDAYIHFTKRYLVLMGLGSMLVTLENITVYDGDPFIIQTMLFFAVAISFITWMISLVFKDKALRLRNIAKAISLYSCMALGTISIFVNGYDAIRQLISKEDNITIYETSYMHWSIFHLIGFTGLLSLVFAHMKTKWKIVSWSIYTSLYCMIQMIPLVESRRDILVLGGMWGTTGYVIVLLGAMIFMELYQIKGKFHYPYLVFMLVNVMLSILSVLFLSSSARGVSINYLLPGMTMFSFLFYIMSLFDKVRLRFDPLAWWGRNPIMIFLVGLLFYIFLMIWNPVDPPAISIVLFYSVSFIAIMTTSMVLEKKKLVIRI